MGQQIEMFSQPKGLTHEQKKVIELFNSGKKECQVLALLQCKNVGLSKGKLLHDYVFSDFDQHKITEDWGLAYANGDVSFWKHYKLLNISLLGHDFYISDDGVFVYWVFTGRRISTFKAIAFAKWEGKAVDEIMTKVFSKLRELTLNHAEYLLGDCLQNRE